MSSTRCQVVLCNNAGMGTRPAAAALVEQNHPIDVRIEVAPHRRAAAAPRTTMQHQHRDTFRIAALFHIDLVALANVEHPLFERVDRRIKILNCALLVREFVHETPI